jgi:hypothetical protein
MKLGATTFILQLIVDHLNSLDFQNFLSDFPTVDTLELCSTENFKVFVQKWHCKNEFIDLSNIIYFFNSPH